VTSGEAALRNPQSGGSATRGGDKTVRVQVGSGEAQVVITPDEIAMLHTEGAELIGFKKDAHFGMLRIPKKGSEIDLLLNAVVEPQTKAIIACLLDAYDIDDWRIHGSCLVIFSRETDLWRTK